MLLTRFAALSAALSLVSLPAAASPSRLAHLGGDPAAGYSPAGTHEVLVTPAPPAPPTAPASPTTSTPPEPYADPTVSAAAARVIITVAPPPRVPAPPRPPRRGLGLMITGFSLFGTSYLLTGFTGARLMDNAQRCGSDASNCRDMGRSMMIPIVGPALAAREVDAGCGGAGLLMVSAIQLATFVMGVVGAVRWSRYKRWERNFAGLPLGRSGLALQTMTRLDGGGVGLNYRF